MDNLFQEETPEKRVEMLEANCLRIEEEPVKRFFTEDELLTMKNDLSDLSINRNDSEEELKEISKGIRASIKSFTSQIKENLKNLKKKYTVNKEVVYLFDDQENGMMRTYNVDGIMISSRRLLPSEKQTRIHSIKKTA